MNSERKAELRVKLYGHACFTDDEMSEALDALDAAELRASTAEQERARYEVAMNIHEESRARSEAKCSEWEMVAAAKVDFLEFPRLKCPTCGKHRLQFDLISFLASVLRANGEDVMQAAVRVRRELTAADVRLATANVTIDGLFDERDATVKRADAAERREQSLRDDYETTEDIVQAYAMALRIDPHTPKEKCVELVKALERRVAEAERRAESDAISINALPRIMAKAAGLPECTTPQELADAIRSLAADRELLLAFGEAKVNPGKGLTYDERADARGVLHRRIEERALALASVATGGK